MSYQSNSKNMCSSNTTSYGVFSYNNGKFKQLSSCRRTCILNGECTCSKRA